MNLRDHLLAIRDETGLLTPAAVVTAATPEDHPLHSALEWDNTVAGHAYRLSQARELIRSVKIAYDRSDGPVSIRGFLSVTRDESREYVPTDEVLTDEFASKLVLQEMRREFLAFKRRYEHLAEYAGLLSQEAAAI